MRRNVCQKGFRRITSVGRHLATHAKSAEKNPTEMRRNRGFPLDITDYQRILSAGNNVFSCSIFAPASSSTPKVFNFTHHPSEPDIIPFSSETLAKGGDDWSLCLVSYSIGRRPFYEALLGALNKTWALKDFDMAWSKGVWFMLGKPFVLQKWHPKFKPKRENFSLVPIWVKIHDFPLACWNSEGISRIASKIGVPLVADHLTELKSGLTFARVCVLVDCNATYPKVIKVSLDGDVVELKLVTILLLQNLSLVEGVSARNLQTVSIPDPPRSESKPKDASTSAPTVANLTSTTPLHTNSIDQPLHYQAHSPPPPSFTGNFQVTGNAETIPPTMPHSTEGIPKEATLSDSIVASIPNLNIPTEEHSASSCYILATTKKPSTSITSPNKFEILNSQIVIDPQENFVSSSDLIDHFTKQPGKGKKQATSEISKKSAKGKQSRIWIKWNASKLTFVPSMVTPQMISGMVKIGNQSPFQFSFVYASNNAYDRKALWNSISMAVPSNGIPWAIAGDFNCCRYASEKSGGSVLHHSNLIDINSMIFDNNLVDLHYVGSFFTWFNQQADNPILIKLDRALVNEEWVMSYPKAYCSFQSPSCSDHSPIIFHSGLNFITHHRNPLSHLCNTLRQLKGDIKKQQWANSQSINMQLDTLHAKPLDLLALLQLNPLDASLGASLKEINSKITAASSLQANWVIQRAKTKWLIHGEDDLKFLYAKIRNRKDFYANLHISPILDEEIKTAAFKGYSNSTPGPDDFNYHFYKSRWHIIGPQVCNAIRYFFLKGHTPSGVKATTLAIIPKHRNATYITDYRLISLCNTLYKIIAKIIA
ncbi:uncharacterized protein LOC110108378 [Dendrobium catenatum]|uniref:uncharacterized protein LOC110108378 n=1 Tax=Dendrobium catenatum TaxID=906689 RepID=UPI0010A08D7B|nr:uncharacterized protein LOC110108378 [Dendrobium catenatum]